MKYLVKIGNLTQKTGKMKISTFVLDAGRETYYTEKEQNIAKLSGLPRIFL